ncbi:MAG: DUF1684 domain-containing protein [Bryobacteraceae bacterium]
MSSSLASVICLTMLASDSTYVAETLEWRRKAEERLKADDGWLTVAGLFWLTQGINRAGTAEENEITLPPGSAPPLLGVFDFSNGHATFRAASGVVVKSQGKPISTMTLKSDAEGEPDELGAGSLTMFVIKRGDRYAVRLRDKNSRLLREFTHRSWFPVDERLRVIAQWIPYKPPKHISVPNILGETEQEPCPGVAVFRWNGAEYRLEPVLEDGRLFFIFKDRTAGKQTYPAGRFLYADAGADGTVVLDFNRAYNPPCSFTPYATCPLPPRQNQLPVAIEAGELTYHHE